MPTVTEPRTTRIEVHPAGDTVRTRLRTGVLSPRITHQQGHRLSVTLVATEALLLGGDHVVLEVVVGEGVRLDLTDVAATVAYDGQGHSARWTTRLTVASGASLHWWGEPLVVCDGAIVHRSLHAAVAEGGELLMRDAVRLGRHGEHGGELHCETLIEHAARPAVVEHLVLDDSHRDLPGYLGEHRTIDTVTIVGRRPSPATDIFELAAPGAIHRTYESPRQRGIFARWQ